jgi:hypothetical protein
VKHADQNALRGSIAKHAAISVGAGKPVYADEIDMLVKAIKDANIDDAGETVIPSEPF